MDGGGSGQHVAWVAEGRQVVPHVLHVTRQAEGGRLVLHALGQFLKTIRYPLALFRLARHFAVACLNPLLLHGQGPIDIV